MTTPSSDVLVRRLREEADAWANTTYEGALGLTPLLRAAASRIETLEKDLTIATEVIDDLRTGRADIMPDEWRYLHEQKALANARADKAEADLTEWRARAMKAEGIVVRDGAVVLTETWQETAERTGKMAADLRADLTRAREEAGALRETLGRLAEAVVFIHASHGAGAGGGPPLRDCHHSICAEAEHARSLLSGSASTETSPAREGETGR